MCRLLVKSRVLGLAALAVCFAIGDAAASHPDILRNYRFIPSHSTLQVTGGFAGIDETFYARGMFGLVTGFEEGVSCAAIGCPDPSHIPFAQFVDVNAWLRPAGPFPDDGNLDLTLNLSGLDGTFETTAPNRLHFRGEEGQGWPFRLTAVQHGRLLYLFGENDEGCCDFFHYKFRALAYLTPHADSNLDGSVDAADYVASRKLLGQTVASAGSGSSGSDDYDLWLASYGDSVDFDQFLAGDSGSAAVPEPAAIVLLLISAMALPDIIFRRAIRRASV
jgi:hypothetical protein